MRALHPVELGCAGHLIVSHACRWHRHTQIGSFRVSSVGAYYPGKSDERDTIGAGPEDFYESMVFATSRIPEKGNEGCGCRAVKWWDGLEQHRYKLAGQAQAGHERLVRKYTAIANKKVSR